MQKLLEDLAQGRPRAIARAISIVEDGNDEAAAILASLDEEKVSSALVLGITGPPGAGKSTLSSRLIDMYRQQGLRLGVVAIDPSSSISGGALLGDRIRMMQHAADQDVIVRSMATRGRLGGLCAAAGSAVRILAGSGCSVIIIETVGVGQSEMDIIGLADITAVVLAPGLGDDIQAMKAGLLEVADLLVVNKADCTGAETLFMDMEAMVKERRIPVDSPVKVCKTVASEGAGIEELVTTIAEIDKNHRTSGTRVKRRLAGSRREVLDWALEMLRPRLTDEISKAGMDLRGDPRQLARKVIDTL